MSFLDEQNHATPIAPIIGAAQIETAGTVAHNAGVSLAGHSIISVDVEGGSPPIYINGSSSISVAGSVPQEAGTIVIAGTSEITVEGSIFKPRNSQLNLIVDIIPAGSAPGRYNRLWLPRLKVDGNEIEIISASYSEAANSAGSELQVTLAHVPDKSAFLPTSIVEFGIGKKVAGVWDEATFDTLITDGVIDETNYNLGGEATKPRDTFTVRTSSNLTNRLRSTPATQLIIHDSSRLTLNATDFDIKFDTEGREYHVELKPIANMMLYDLFQEVFVARCGFSSFKTNLPNFSVARVDFQMGRGMLEGVSGYIGQFSPTIFSGGDDIWIVDTTMALPAGFPTPRIIDSARYPSFAVADARQNIDGFRVQYVEDGRDYDSITFRNEYPETDEVADSTERIFREYRRDANPAVVLRDELIQETRISHDGSDVPISDIKETYSYDAQNRLAQRDKTVKGMVPAPDTGLMGSNEEPRMTLIASETETITYAGHPFKARAQYIQRRELHTEGLIAIDTANQQLGQDFKLDLQTAYRRGNLVEGMATDFVPVRSVIEASEPQRNGMVKTRIREIDHLANTVPEDRTEERPGEISISGIAPQPKEILVFEDELSVPTNAQIDDIDAGEMPTDVFIPWARRTLKALKSANRSGTVPLIGYERAVRKGLPFRLRGRKPAGSTVETIGDFLVIGRSITCDRNGAAMELSIKQIPTLSEYVFGPTNPQGLFSLSIDANGTATLIIQVDCVTNYQLYSDNVGSLTVEARRVGVPWTNLETTPIDLSPHNGTRQPFEIRLTAAVVTTVVRRSFTIHVENF